MGGQRRTTLRARGEPAETAGELSAPGGGLLALGRVGGVFGVRGELKVISWTRPPEHILDYECWRIGGRDYALARGRRHGKALVARLAGVDDPDCARELVGESIQVAAADLPAPAPGEYYWHQLIGLRVVGEAGEELGVVETLMETGANDVLVVRGERERLLPYIDEVIQDVDLEARVMRVRWDADF